MLALRLKTAKVELSAVRFFIVVFRSPEKCKNATFAERKATHVLFSDLFVHEAGYLVAGFSRCIVERVGSNQNTGVLSWKG